MNGAQALIRTLVDAGVDTCFANPGTSEMHFVAALDAVPKMRAVLGLFEGVVTGAADGYARMADRPAAALLHLGPGLGNGLANLHNARRARTPVVVVVGDHALPHKSLDAPLESDIDAMAGTVSGWVRRTERTADVGADAADAVRAALGPPGRVATLILPADVSWADGAEPASPRPAAAPREVAEEELAAAAKALRSGEPAVLLIGDRATQEPALTSAARVAAATGCRLICETFPARWSRGAGRPPVERLLYLAEGVEAQLAGVRHLVIAGARPPVSFFAYPGRPSDLVPAGCEVHRFAAPGDDLAGALAALADRVGPADPVLAPAARPPRPEGALTAETFAGAVAAGLPEGAVVADEANTSGLFLAAATTAAPPHDWLTLTGGSIGIGLPLATGAALACPDRPVLCLEADGSAMYTLSALWTQAREQLDVTTVVLANRAYSILNLELQRVGAGAAGPRARDLLDLSRPDLDFVALAAGMGVPAVRVDTAGELVDALARAYAEPGPHLVEAVLPALA
jgi:acetolactate synthase-1/2/3 large subunit